MPSSFVHSVVSSRRTLGFLAEAQERLGALPALVTMREAWLDRAGIAEGSRVLEIGCGTGVVTRALAERVGAFGRVVALDASEALLRAAARLAAGAKHMERVELRLGDATQLDLPPQSFDHVVASMVFQHLPDPSAALEQVRRVLRPGGGVAIFEQDLEALAVDHPDRSLTRVILQHAAEHYVLTADAPRRLPGLLQELGFQEIEVVSFVQAERGEGAWLLELLRRFADLAVAQGRVREGTARAWVGVLERKSRERTYFAALPYYAMSGRKSVFSG